MKTCKFWSRKGASVPEIELYSICSVCSPLAPARPKADGESVPDMRVLPNVNSRSVRSEVTSSSGSVPDSLVRLVKIV